MSSGDTRGSAPAHLLLTVLGTNPRCARYKLEDREAEPSPLAPVALMELLPENARPGRILALCTDEAKAGSLPLLEAALDARYPACSVCPVRVPGGDEQQDVDEFLRKVVGEIGQGVELTVDVTHGFRHFSFLMYVAVLYLVALRGVTVRGAYYGMQNSNSPTSPFLDLRPLLDLPRWVYALEVLRDTGSTLPMARNLCDGRDGRTARDIARDLKCLSEAYLSALPLELGWQARKVLDERRKPLRKLLDRDHRLPLAGKLVDGLAEILKTYEIPGPASGNGWKRQVRLCASELKRQAGIIDGLLEHENYATAFGLMCEWLVSWAVYQQSPADGWLDGKVRRRAAGTLHAIRAICEDPDLCDVLDEEQRQLGPFWKDLSDIRNAYAHHGMRPENLVHKKAAVSRDCVLERWKCLFRSSPTISLSIGESPGGRVLVSPIGLRPGVLFSAVQAVRAQHGEPALCLVIASRETEGMIAEALGRAGFSGDCKPLILEDAFAGGADEIERIGKAARKHLVGAAGVFVNVTGGTTLMGLGAEKLATEARSLACPVRRFGLIDRRSAQRQDVDPYQAGEPFWLDTLE